MHALVMAGGKGSRLGLDIEKPLVRLNDKVMIEYVLDALIKSSLFNRVLVSVSRNTPNTKVYLSRCDAIILHTSGDDYANDLIYSLNYISNHWSEPTLIMPCDLPLVDADLIKDIVSRYNYNRERYNDSWVAITLSDDLLRSLKLSDKPRVYGTDQYYSGISIVDPDMVDTSDRRFYKEEYILVDDIRAAVNVNTLEDLKIAEMMSQRLT
jgi:adenosylcobinamide-phosphate guanylyltransferase